MAKMLRFKRRQVVLTQLAIIITISIVCWNKQTLYIDLNKNHIYVVTTQHNNTNITLPSMTTANCSNAWRKQYQIPMENQTLFYLIDHKKDPYLNKYNPYAYYKVSKIPKRTFTYWLSHIVPHDSKKLQDKVYFADKFKVKQYIDKYTNEYPQFNSITYARILYDFDDGNPSFQILQNLSKIFNGFLIKPNHFSGRQVIVESNETLTHGKYRKIIEKSRLWVNHRYKQMDHKVNREPWYKLIKPHVFIEENININPEKYHLTEYKINVFNYKALFCYIHRSGFEINQPTSMLNLYTLPDFKLLNVRWTSYIDSNWKVPIPSTANLDIMIKFAESFARTERFRYVRVDLYEVNGRIYFSEFTFSPISGNGVILPIEFDYLLYNILICNQTEDIDKIYEYTKNRKEQIQFERPQTSSADLS